MSTKPRIKVPESAKVGEVIEVKTLVQHVMETGNRRDKDNNVIPRLILNTFEAKFAGQEVFKTTIFSGTAANPYIAFFMKVPGPGEFEFTWHEDGGAKITEKVALKVA
ncbi:MAG: thiosulfate oxidation carrier complex protein SoxZ [Hyphomicrobiaceae bacterium]